MLEFAITSFASIFAIVNPIGNLTFFVTLTEGYADELKRRVINKTVVVAVATLLIFGLAGGYIFALFNTSIHAFRIAGGILLFAISFSMLHGQRSRTQLTARDREEALAEEAVGVVPLGIPLYAGPGAITTVVLLISEAQDPLGNPADVLRIAIVMGAVLLTMGIAYVLLLYSDRVFEMMGRMGALAFSRVMGLILMAIAIQFVIVGIRGAYLAYFVP